MVIPAHSSQPASAVRYPLSERPVASLRVGERRLLPVGPLRMYTCGITPYDVTHVGHASTFVRADLIASVAKATGTGVSVARNVTDIDDVLTAAAQERGRHFDELALTQEFLFDRDMKALSVAAPGASPHARAHVPAVLRLAAALLESGAAYESEGHVYFRGAHVPGTCGLAEREALERSRQYGDQDEAPGRESEFDVAVWRPSPPEHPAWPSPWGWGRPGWHAECAAMAVATLGTSIDVLLGGADLAFPHHAYQVAMVEAASGVRPFASAVVHVAEVRQGGEKMAKSTGNLVLVRDLLERYDGPTIRLALLDRPLDEPWDCEDAVFDRAHDRLHVLYDAAGSPSEQRGPHLGVLETLADGLDVPAALARALDEGADAVGYALELLKLRPAG